MDADIRQYAKRLWAVLFGSATGQLVSVAVSPLLTRLYAPEDFGVLGFYVSIFGVLAVLASLRLDLAIPSAPSRSEANRITLASLAFGSVIAFLSAPVSYVSLKYQSDDIAAYWYCVPLAAVFFSASNATSAWAIYYRQYRTLGRVRLQQSLSSASVQLLWPLAFAGPLGLILGALVMQAGGVAVIGLKFIRTLRKRGTQLFGADLFATLIKYKTFPLVVMPASVLSRAAVHIPLPLLLHYHGAAFAGFVMLSQRIIGLPGMILGRAAVLPLQREIGRAHRRGKSGMGAFIWTIGALAVPGLLMMVVVMALGPQLFALVFGEQWRVAGWYAVLLAPAFFFQLISMPVAQLQSVSGKGVGQLATELIRLIIIFCSVIIPAEINLNIDWAILIYSAALCVVYLAYIVFGALAILNPGARSDL